MIQPPLIGILAGMGPHSTAPFVDLVVDECQRQYGARCDDEFPPMMIVLACTDPNAVSATTHSGFTILDPTRCLAAAVVREWVERNGILGITAKGAMSTTQG